MSSPKSPICPLVYKDAIIYKALTMFYIERENRVAKTSRAPSGFYTASEAMKRLGYASSTFYEYVDAGKIKKVVPPGKKEGYYLKAEVDKMIRAREAFILQYATDTTLFEK